MERLPEGTLEEVADNRLAARSAGLSLLEWVAGTRAPRA